MTLAVNKNKQGTEREWFVRISGVYNVTDELVADGADYTAIFPTQIVGVYQAGVSKTFTQIRDNITISGLSVPSASAPVVLTYYIYLSSRGSRLPDPDLGGGDKYWEPRLGGNLQIAETAANVLAGTVSTSPTSFSLLNADKRYQKHINANGSFFNRPVVIWLRASKQDTPEKVAEYITVDLTNSKREIVFNIRSQLARLSVEPTFGDALDERVLSLTTPNVSVIGLNPPDLGQAIPFYYGTSTKWAGGVPGSNPDVSKLPKAMCVDPQSDTAIGTQNRSRVWLLGRCASFQNFGTYHNITSSTATYVTVSSSVIKQYQTGYIIFFRDSSNNLITSGGNVLGRTLLRVDYTNNRLYVNSVPGGAARVEPQRVILAFKKLDGTEQFTTPWDFSTVTGSSDRHTAVTLSSVPTQGGNFLVYATLADNEEGSFLSDNLNPYKYTCGFHWVLGDDTNHTDLVTDLAAGTKLTINTPALTTSAAVELPVNGRVPGYTETQYSNVLQYMETLAQSSGTLLSTTIDGEIIYQTFQAGGLSNRTLTDNDIIEDSFSSQENYREIAKTVQFENQALSTEYQQFFTTFTEEQAETLTNHLFNADKTVKWPHISEDYTVRKSVIATLLGNSQRRYFCQLQFKHLDLVVGDIVTLNTKLIDQPVDVVVISRSISTKTISVTLQPINI